MRCEICNRSMTETVIDGAGEEHEYCQHCDGEIKDTLASYDDDEDDWFFLDWEVDPDLSEEDLQIVEDYQRVNDEPLE